MAREIQQLKAGRLSITCIDAKNIRGRIDDSKGGLSPYLLFRLNGTERTSKTGNQLGHDVLFNNEVILFDLPQPKETELIIEVCDDESNESVGRATFSIADVLTSGAGKSFAETLQVIKPGDTTTNSVVNLKFSFVEAKVGVVKLRLDSAESATTDDDGTTKDSYTIISTPDGQSKRASLSDYGNNALGFWMDPTNWFSDFSIQTYKEGDCIGGGKLSLLDCLKGNEIKNATSHVPVGTDGGGRIRGREVPVVVVNHWFLEAGVVRVKSIRASDLRDVSIGSTGLANPRVVVKSHGKTHSTVTMTNAAVDVGPNSYQWDDDIPLSVVDEYALTIECSEVDEVSGDQEPIGSAELSLLPLFKNGRLDTSVDLKHVTELGESLEGGRVNLVLTFEAPRGAAFPRDQPTMTSYTLGLSDTIMRTKKNMDMDEHDDTFTEDAIEKAFTMFDLDKNGYIGVAELKHILIMMGEHISDEEVDMMISMLDLNGDGQVSFKEFKAMAESPDPAEEDFLQGGIPAHTSESIALQQRNEQAEKKREVFTRCVQTCRMEKEDVYGMLKMVKHKHSSSRSLSHESFYVGYEDICELMPAASLLSRSDCRTIFDLLRGGEETIDSRDLITTFTNFVAGFGLEERCKLAFDMYDVDHSGYLSIDEVEEMMMSTNLTTRDLIKKRAENFMLCADTDRSGGITIDEFIVAAEKLPNLLYPPQTKQR